MPPEPLKLAHTIEFKIRMVMDYRHRESRVNRTQFCKGRTFSRSTHQLWDKQLIAMENAVQLDKRGKCLTMGGSGHVSLSKPVEDALCVWIKDERREERPVSIEGIILECSTMLPDFIDLKSHEASKSWCASS
jgi:hypothetical protein